MKVSALLELDSKCESEEEIVTDPESCIPRLNGLSSDVCHSSVAMSPSSTNCSGRSSHRISTAVAPSSLLASVAISQELVKRRAIAQSSFRARKAT
jgi:hypothetical protein